MAKVSSIILAVLGVIRVLLELFQQRRQRLDADEQRARTNERDKEIRDLQANPEGWIERHFSGDPVGVNPVDDDGLHGNGESGGNVGNGGGPTTPETGAGNALP